MGSYCTTSRAFCLKMSSLSKVVGTNKVVLKSFGGLRILSTLMMLFTQSHIVRLLSFSLVESMV